ncbi:helix-turn-helix domain-containing protein [Pseudonocardia broussonetiae]|uniref:helix-turn-helix domain-containing protein n=1 Tax=Pseudonocardia broussonetiae TaxID=2736640 RepID=UPI001962B3FB|nr:helix-turn-helix transcriptional regulator [Pseudonocardia broussonetiae]
MTGADDFAANRARQAALYGAPLGDRVRTLVTVLGISQARLARTLGMSPAMLSQLASGRRVKIGSPAVLARLQMLDHRCAAVARPLPPAAVEALLAEVARAQLRWSPAAAGAPAPRPRPPAPGPGASRGSAADALRRVAAPARLAAAAAALGPGFPELAEVLRQAAGRPG